MDKNRRIKIDILTTVENQVLELTIWHRPQSKSYHMSLQPMKVEPTETPGVVMRSFMAFTGANLPLASAPRFSRKRLEELADSAKDSEEYRRLLDYIKEKNPEIQLA